MINNDFTSGAIYSACNRKPAWRYCLCRSGCRAESVHVYHFAVVDVVQVLNRLQIVTS